MKNSNLHFFDTLTDEYVPDKLTDIMEAIETLPQVPYSPSTQTKAYPHTKRNFATAIAACICLLITGGIFLNYYSNDELGFLISSINSDSSEPNKYNNSVYGSSNNIIKINDVNTFDGLFTEGMFDLGEENFSEMSRQEVLKYFGIDIPADFYGYKDNTSRYGFYHDAFGKVFDQQTFLYNNSDNNSEIQITLRKNALPVYQLLDEFKNVNKSFISGTKVIIMHCKSDDTDSYYCEFMVNDIGITIHCSNMQQSDFVSLIEYFAEQVKQSN